MRRLISALSIKRDKSDDASTVSTSTPHTRLPKSRSGLFSKAPKVPITTEPVIPPQPWLAGSSASSDGSASLRTPEEEVISVMPNPEGKRWTTWWGKKPSENFPELHQESLDHMESEDVGQQFRPTLPPPPPTTREDSDSDEDESSSESSHSTAPHTSNLPTMLDPHSLLRSQTSLITVTRNALIPSQCRPPLMDITSASLYPRSSNLSRTLPSQQTTESTMHRKALLRRLERKDLSRAEQYSISVFATRPKPTPTQRPLRKTEDDSMSSDLMRVGLLSRGLRRWASRPCFEARFVIWAPDRRGGVEWRRVEGSGRGLAVAELEISESTEILAGTGLNDRQFDEALHAPTQNSYHQTVHPRHPSQSRTVSFKSKPSPLRMEHGAHIVPALSTGGSSEPSPAFGISEPHGRRSLMPPREVRFADLENDKDDDVPLGMQMKKKREKDSLLRAEQQRKAWEVEQAQIKEERRRLEEEQRAREEEKRIREERRKSQFAEEVTAARIRRDRQRSGSDNYTMVKEDQDTAREPSYSRPAYDLAAKRSSSSWASLENARISQSRSRNEPSSSIPPSPSGSISSRRSSFVQPNPFPPQPPSGDALGKKDRRLSTFSQSSSGQHLALSQDPSKRISLPRSYSTPQPGNMYPVYPFMAAPPVPPLPWDMSLLPPSPAFMQQQHPRSNSRSSSRSRDSSPSRSPSGFRPVNSSDPIQFQSRYAQKPQHARFSSGEGPTRQHAASPSGGVGVPGRRASRAITPSHSPPQELRTMPVSQTPMTSRGRPDSKRRTTTIM